MILQKNDFCNKYCLFVAKLVNHREDYDIFDKNILIILK